jgi:hypothetical protein
VIPVWGDYDRNIYYNPEKCGATIVGTLEDDEPYQFDIVLVVKRGDNTMWAAHDSGCSCPTPFENVHGWGDMTPLRNMEDFENFVDSNSYARYKISDVLALGRKVRDGFDALADVPPLALRRALGPGLGIGSR